ncbi:MAG: dioxygenase [Gammaproteobacteria bacterium]
MATINLDNITQAVIEHGDGGKKNPRLYQIYTSLVRHLHGFAREVNLSTEELEIGRRFLFRLAQPNQDFPMGEVHLMSDCLGISELCILLDEQGSEKATGANVEGPLLIEGAPERELGAKIGEDDDGDPLFVYNRVLDLGGTPIAGAVVDIWQPRHDGHYFVQEESQQEWNFYAKIRTNEQGECYFQTVIPGNYAVPTSGPTGNMLDQLGRHGERPAHIHYRIQAEGYPTFITMAYMKNSPYIDSDTIFSVKDLKYDPQRHDSEEEMAARGVDKPFYTVDYDFRLRPIP